MYMHMMMAARANEMYSDGNSDQMQFSMPFFVFRLSLQRQSIMPSSGRQTSRSAASSSASLSLPPAARARSGASTRSPPPWAGPCPCMSHTNKRVKYTSQAGPSSNGVYTWNAPPARPALPVDEEYVADHAVVDAQALADLLLCVCGSVSLAVSVQRRMNGARPSAALGLMGWFFV